MSDRRIANLEIATSLGSNDFFVTVVDPSGVPQTKGVTKSVLFANVGSNANFSRVTSNTFMTANSLSVANLVVENSNTPTSSATSSTRGMIWFDANYIYVATANNTVKRAALLSF